MALTSMQMFTDRNGNKYPLPVAAGYINYRVLAASTAEAPAVPTGAQFVVVYSPIDAYVALSGTAAVPAADVTDGTGVIFVPTGYPRVINVGGLTSFSIISAAAGIVGLEFYS